MAIQTDPLTGIVYRPVGYSGERWCVYWAQCPTCGPQVPVTTILMGRNECVLATANDYQGQRPIIGLCSRCGGKAPLREAIVPASPGGRREGKCGTPCLKGKFNCNCRCLGQCHGEGRHYCDEPLGGKS